MGYPLKNRLPDERIVCRGRVSGAAYVGPILLLLIGLATAIFFIGIVLIIMSVAVMIQLWCVEIVATNKRVTGKVGFISKRSLDVRLSKLEGIAVSRGLFGAIFNYGTITISGSGQTRIKFPGIANPEKLRRLFLTAAEEHSNSIPTAPPAPEPALNNLAQSRFQVQIVDRRSGGESWVDVKAINQEDAIQKAAATGAIVGECRLVGID